MSRETNAAKTTASKGVSAAPVKVQKQGPPAHTAQWAANVSAAAKGQPEPHGGAVRTEDA